MFDRQRTEGRKGERDKQVYPFFVHVAYAGEFRCTSGAVHRVHLRISHYKGPKVGVGQGGYIQKKTML